MPLVFPSPFLSKIELLKPSKMDLAKKYVKFFLILGWSRTKMKRLRNAVKMLTVPLIRQKLLPLIK